MKNTLRIKFFSIDEVEMLDHIETKINKWLEGNPDITVRNIQQSFNPPWLVVAISYERVAMR